MPDSQCAAAHCPSLRASRYRANAARRIAGGQQIRDHGHTRGSGRHDRRRGLERDAADGDDGDDASRRLAASPTSASPTGSYPVSLVRVPNTGPTAR